MSASVKRIIVTGVAMAVIMAVAAATVWIGLNRRYKAPSPMRCLPDRTAFVVRLGDRHALGQALGKPEGVEIVDLLGGTDVRLMALRVDTLFGSDVIGAPSLSERDLYVSFALAPDGSATQLAASFQLNNRMEWHKAMSALRERQDVVVSDTAISGHGLFVLRQADYEAPLFMAAGGGCLFASTTPDLLMTFGRDTVTTLRDNAFFAQIERTVSPTADASIFINGKEIAKAADMMDGTIGRIIRSEGAGSDWMAFDVSLSDHGISADGFAVAQRQTLAMLTSKENSSSLGLARRVPKDVGRFFRIGGGRRGISSPSFSDFLSQDTIGVRYRAAQSDLYSQTGADIEALLSQVFDSELALCSYAGASAGAGGEFLVVDTHGGTKAHAIITQALTALHGGAQPMVIGEIQPGAAAVPEGVVAKRADAEQISVISIPVYGGFEDGDNTFFLDVLLGQRVPGKLFFRYEDALVFANDMQTLRKVLIDYVTGNTMEGDPTFDDLMSHFGNDCSTLTYETLTANQSVPFDMICHQMTRTGNLPYISIFAHSHPVEVSKSEENSVCTWHTRIDSIVGGKLWGVTNHYTRLTECLTQDGENKLCLIGADGMLLWRRPIDGAIVGNVHQIDFYGNGKQQYLLTTDKSLYIIDRLGNDVGDFPVGLPSRSVTGCSAAMYSDGSPMRIFAGCEGGPALFGPDGKAVEGWKASKTEGPLLSAPRHLMCAGKDYIVYNDKYAYYYVDRRGGKRLSTQPLAPSLRGRMTVSGDGRCFITTSSDGNVVAIDGNSGAISTLRLDSIGTDFISRPLSTNSTYVVVGTSKAYIVDVRTAEPKVIASWQTNLRSVSQLKILDGLMIVLDNESGIAHAYSSIDGGEIPASPIKARGSVALGYGMDGFVAFTLSETGDVMQVNLTKGKVAAK